MFGKLIKWIDADLNRFFNLLAALAVLARLVWTPWVEAGHYGNDLVNSFCFLPPAGDVGVNWNIVFLHVAIIGVIRLAAWFAMK